MTYFSGKPNSVFWKFERRGRKVAKISNPNTTPEPLKKHPKRAKSSPTKKDNIFLVSQKPLNSISGTPSKLSTGEIEELIEEKIREFIKSDEFKRDRAELHRNIEEENGNHYDNVIVQSEVEIIEYSKKGYDCQKIDEKMAYEKGNG